MNDSEQPIRPGTIANSAEPIRITDIKLIGVAAGTGRQGQEIPIQVRLALTSDDRAFDRVASGLVDHLEHMAGQQGKSTNLRHANNMLAIIRPDETADIFVDSAAVVVRAMTKRAVAAGAPIFERDIADVLAVEFPAVGIGPGDAVIYLFREAWRFGLFFDFNPERQFDTDRMSRTIGTLLRTMRYRHLYDVLADAALFDELLDLGWFPFAEALPEYRQLSDTMRAGLSVEEVETQILETFDRSRVEHMFERWNTKPHFQQKEALLRAGVNAYLAGEPIAAIKIIMTEIEGILNEAHRARYGRGAKIKGLLAFAIASAESKVGSLDTLLFPAAFARYLESHTFANFDPTGPAGDARSRHAIGHGAARADSYTAMRALQALLTLDQLSFYT